MGTKHTKPTDYRHRTYRHQMQRPGLVGYRVSLGETDLHVQTPENRAATVEDLIRRHREPIERYITDHPGFATTLSPWVDTEPVPSIVGRMMEASRRVQVGPMAAVAGAIAEGVGRGLLKYDSEVIVENGGDLFFRCQTEMTIGLFAGKSPMSGRIGWRVNAEEPMALCTSSATIGHSVSFGCADATAVLSENGALADAAATAIGNWVHRTEDIGPAIDKAKSIPGIRGILVIVGEAMGAWGEVNIQGLDGNNG